MRKTIFAILLSLAFLLCCAFATKPAHSAVCYVSVETFDSIHGAGTIRVMAVRDGSSPTNGETVVILRDPCQPLLAVFIVDIVVDYNQSQPGHSEDGAFFDFIVPNSGCHGRYIIGVTAFDGGGMIEGGTTFKY
jgi:hypothetical protein